MKLLVVKNDDVRPRSLHIACALANVAFALHNAGHAQLVALPFEITAGENGKHSRKSRHYFGVAIDQRSKDMDPIVKEEVREHLQNELGPEYDVILEGRGTDNEHFHIEWDPK